MAMIGVASFPKSAWVRAVLSFLAITACTDRNSPTRDTGDTARTPYDAGVEGLPEAVPGGTLEAQDGDTVRLRIGYVAKRISGKMVRMLAYNGSVPGPTLKIPLGAEITVLLENGTDLPTTLHSHGVRMDYRSDGVPGVGLPVTGSGQVTAYRIRFPDAGVFWYHPHFREDYQMELGLYGSYLVAPADSAYWQPVNREVVLMLDDISIHGNVIETFYKEVSDHTLMGRFGNVMLINGDDAFTMHVKRNETIRFYVVNASSARAYNLRYSRDMDLNIVGADNGRFEYPDSRENYLLAPSERVIFQLHFNDGLDDYDTLELWSQAPNGSSVLGRFVYDADTVEQDFRSSVNLLQSLQAKASIDSFRASADNLPDEEILLTGYMDMTAAGLSKRSAAEHDPDPKNAMGVEWSDSVHGESMIRMNAMSDSRNMHWIIRDVRTGKENHAINWAFKRGSQVLIRVRNDSATTGAGPGRMFHPMPHPIHFHGQRFLVVRVNGSATTEALAWRDSYLIGRGFTVDLLLDASNPGDWMFHCHIAEHLQDDMMGHFRVLDEVAERTPFPWSLSLALAAPIDSLRRDTALAEKPPVVLSGAVNGADEAADRARSRVLDGFVHFLNAEDPSLRVSAPLDAGGGFSLSSTALFGTSDRPATIKAFLKANSAVHAPSPDTLRIRWDPRGSLAWSLDLDLAGDVSFAALRRDTSATTGMKGEISGKVNAYGPETLSDSVYFKNMFYPEFTVTVPIGPDGTFRFDAFDLVGELDGQHSLRASLKSAEGRAFDPDSLIVHVAIP